MPDKKLSAYHAKRDFTQTREPSGERPRQGLRTPPLRHPEARRHPAALRPAAGTRRRVQVLGGDPRPVARPARQAPGRRGRGPPARLRRLRGHHPQGPIWRRHRAALGPRLLGAAGHDGGAGPGLGRPEVHPGGRAPARQLGAGADQGLVRQAGELAADQAPRRAARTGDAEACSRRTARSRPGAPWPTSPRARAGRPSRSCVEARPRRRTRSGTPPSAWRRACAAEGKTTAKAGRRSRPSRDDARLHRAAALPLGRAAARRGGWVHEIKFDGYRVQVRIERRQGRPAHPQGARLDGEVPGASPRLRALPDGIVDGEIVALDAHGAPDFAALQAAIADGRPTSWCSSPSTCCSPRARTCAAAAVRAQDAAAGDAGRAAPASLLRYVDHFDTGGDAVLHSACRCRWRASSPSRPTRPIDPAAARAGPRPSAAPGTRW